MRTNVIYRILLITLCLIANCGLQKAIAQENDKQQTLLILNSYNEQALWSRTLVAPITLFVANDDRMHAEIFSLNNVLITDSASYNQVKNNLFDTYSQKKPDYLVIIGNLAFTMRDDIKAHWGDIPILLITRDMTLAPTEYFFSGTESSVEKGIYPTIGELRKDFNFTTIYVPDFYRETIDLMNSMIPDMEEVVFLSDQIFLNRHLAKEIELYLYEKYPEVSFKWVQASGERPDELQHYFVHDLPHTGLLMSTWYYEKKSAFGYPSLVSGDMNLLNSSINPVFSLREVNMSLGAIGGVFANTDSVNSEITRMLEAMVRGESMRDIKFVNNKHDYVTKVSYPKLEEYGISPGRCPKGTEFVDRPKSFWEKYAWQIIAVTIILLLIALLAIRRNATQRRELQNLRRHRRFVDMMPVPYTKAKIIYDDQGTVINIKYTLYNQAFEKILKENAYSVEPYLIFPNDFIAEKTTELLNSQEKVSFRYYFDKTDTYYIFSLCFVDATMIKDKEVVEEIDLFAIDVTERQKTQEQLTLLTRRLDRTLNVANMIPWEWRLKGDELEFDAYSLFTRSEHTFSAEGNVYGANAKMTTWEHIAQVHPEDREKVREIGRKIVDGELSEFKIEYRMPMVRGGKMIDEWVEVNGMVTKTDTQGKPLVVNGSMCLITKRKNQEQALIAAREKATESDKLKSAFLANMSHEIRTPLNAIIGFSSLLCETDDIEKRKEFSAIINQNNDMLLSLITDVLDLSKIESNTLEMVYTTVDLNKMLASVGETAKMRLHPGVVLNLVEGQSECKVTTDGNRLCQVLMNLLTNAAKFTLKGNIIFGYDVVDNKELYFYVKDTGIGVSADNQGRLFKRFDKINNFTQGNGLGLSICKSIVELLGGSIGMKSRGEGKGSTFWFTIPYKPVDTSAKPGSQLKAAVTELLETELSEPLESKAMGSADADEPKSKEPKAVETKAEEPKVEETKAEEPKVEEPKSETAKSETADKKPARRSMEEPNGEGKLILVAEDVEGNYLLLKHLIPKSYKIIHAWDGQEAVDMYNQHKPDLVMMDILMPTMDGYKATEALRKVSDTVPIIAVTAFAYASDIKRILKSGFNDYLSKPVIREELFEMLKRWG